MFVGDTMALGHPLAPSQQAPQQLSIAQSPGEAA